MFQQGPWIPPVSPISEEAQEYDQAWGHVWECPWLAVGDVSQGHPLQEEPDDGVAEGTGWGVRLPGVETQL